MTLVNALVYTGVFERFPTLTLLFAEVGTGWLPFLFREIDDRVSPVAELFLGKSKLPLRPSEYLARNVDFTDPIVHYGEALKAVAPGRRERFFGASMADVYARMGDPLAIP